MTSMSTEELATADLQQGLEKVWSELRVPIIFGHLCKGNLQKAGALRLSGVKGEPAFKKRKIAGRRDHAAAFQIHVERFGRENTLLNWLVCWTRTYALPISREGDENTIVKATFLIRQSSKTFVEIVECTSSSVVVAISRGLLLALLPDGLVDEYLRTLYYPSPAVDFRRPEVPPGADTRQQKFREFTAPQLRLFAAMINAWRLIEEHDEFGKSKRSLTTLCYPYEAARKNFELESLSIKKYKLNVPDVLQLLSSLQIAFAYVAHFHTKCLLSEEFDGGIVSVCRTSDAPIGQRSETIDVRRRPGKASNTPLIALSASADAETRATALTDKLAESLQRDPLSRVLSRVEQYSYDVAHPNIPYDYPSVDFTSPASEDLRRLLTEKIPEAPFEQWCEYAPTWIAHLISLLRGTKHEGKQLEFTLVIGDKAQIDDSSLFESLELNKANFTYPPPHGSQVDVIKSLNDAKRVITKENYFWFQSGRYALLWDLAFPQNRPGYLLGLKDSSWRVFAENARNRQKPAAAEAAVVVGYLDERGAGGLIIGGEHKFSLSHEGRWIKNRDKLLESHVAGYLKAANKGGILKDEEFDKLLRTIVAVSNDPDSGCMVVLAGRKDTYRDFRSMGASWKVTEKHEDSVSNKEVEKLSSLSDDKMIALLSMDGSAVLWKQDDSCHIAFRRLVRPAVGEAARHICPGVTNSLSGEGSRKWSALLTACRTDVRMVIAVSQDGPVHFYTTRNIAEEAYRKLGHNELPEFIKDCECEVRAAKDRYVLHDKIL
jgi:hypothetical protein